MVTLTLSVPQELKEEMDETPEINWSEVARAAIKEKIKQLKAFNALVANSKLTEEDALELGKKINKSLHERLRKEHPGAF